MLIKKYKSLIIIFCLLITFSIQTIKAEELPLFGVIITVDAGHGGRDPGTSYGNIEEKDVNLEISKKLEEELTKNGAIVYMVRDSDIDLSSIYDSRKKRGDLYRRIKYIEKNQSDLYLSIHLNWYKNSSYRGAEVLYSNINENNRILASSLQEQFNKEIGTNRKIKTTDLYLYRNTKTSGVLIECGFISNYQDRTLVTTKKGQEKISKIITDGVIDYLEKIKKEKIIL